MITATDAKELLRELEEKSNVIRQAIEGLREKMESDAAGRAEDR